MVILADSDWLQQWKTLRQVPDSCEETSIRLLMDAPSDGGDFLRSPPCQCDWHNKIMKMPILLPRDINNLQRFSWEPPMTARRLNKRMKMGRVLETEW
jgi:hypothetical protein